MSIAEFFHMGGYAFYVWGAYGFAALALIINLLQPVLEMRNREFVDGNIVPASGEG